ncbi:MAG TPA: nuclear transport factor 2 family protein, partial [Afifellaceae bacterium]|nr:nuclear transport factor 2 family protein [Afifellaceae bacterium]
AAAPQADYNLSAYVGRLRWRSAMDVETRVSQLTGPYVKAWNECDPDNFAALWTRDGILWSALGPEIRGREAIRAWAAAQGSITGNLVMEPGHCDGFLDAIFVVGDYIVERWSPGPVFSRGGFTAVLLETGERMPKMHRLVAFPKRST